MKLVGKIFIILALCFFATQTVVPAADKGVFNTSPKLNDGKKWRVGYYEGGEYIDYQLIFAETIKGLMKLGWIKTAQLPPLKGEETKGLWEWLSTKAQSNYIDFVKDAHYSANWDDKIREETAAKVIVRLNSNKDLDLMIAMGTWAGKDLANNSHQTKTMVVSASDAVGAGIIKSVDDSGFDHVHAYVDPFRYERQLKVFHDIIGFQKLGVAYEDSEEGRSYAAIDKIELLAKERGFEIVRCFTKSDVSDEKLAEKSVIDCFNNLAAKADAIYVTVQGGINKRSIPKLVEIVNTHKIPTFSQSGSEEVKYGFLTSLSQAGFKYVGQWHAETFAKVFNGAQPRQLGQIFEEPKKIAINLKTAVAIGFDPPVDVLGAADEIYEDIIVPN